MGMNFKKIYISFNQLSRAEIKRHIKYQIKNPLIFVDLSLFILYFFVSTFFFLLVTKHLVTTFIFAISLSALWNLSLGFSTWVSGLNNRIYIFDEKRIIIQIKDSKKYVKWSDITCTKNHSEGIGFYYRTKVKAFYTKEFVFLPKRFLKSDAEIEAFYQLFFSHVESLS